MGEYGFSLTRILPHLDRIVDSVLMQKNKAQGQPVFSHILDSEKRKKLSENDKINLAGKRQKMNHKLTDS